MKKSVNNIERITGKSNSISIVQLKTIALKEFWNKMVKFFSPKNVQDRVAFGLTLAFMDSLNYARQFDIPKSEEEKIMGILDRNKNNKKYELINFHYSKLGEERLALISEILLHYAKIPIKVDSEKVKQLPPYLGETLIEKYTRNKDNSTLEMYYLVEKFVRNIPAQSLEKISEIVKSGASKYYQENKQYKEKWKGCLGEKYLKLAVEISNNKDSLYIATGMIISSLLSHNLGRTSLTFSI